MTFAISSDYHYVLFGAALTAIQVLVLGFVLGGASRKKHFTKAFFDKNFEGVSIPKGGYPDNGSGIFAHKLSVANWIDFNNYQRAHQNFLESVTTVVTLLLVAGVYYPRLSFLSALVHFVGRILYTIGYIKSGAKGRLVGALTADVVILVLIVATFCGTLSAAGGVSGLVTFVLGSK